MPSPFKLLYSVATPTPFKLEARVHRHFDTHRIRESGACTEFFNVEAGAVGSFLEKLRDA